VTSQSWIILLALGLLGGACNDDDANGDGRDAGRANCLPALSLDCEPTYPATFEAFFEHRIARTCGAASTGMSCHGPDGNQGGLVLSDMDESYDALLGGIDGKPRVIPGDPECSILMQRLESEDPEFVMPVGMRLSEGERCAVRQWIAAGAEP
jgi:Planctomycete cytochrome C